MFVRRLQGWYDFVADASIETLMIGQIDWLRCNNTDLENWLVEGVEHVNSNGLRWFLLVLVGCYVSTLAIGSRSFRAVRKD